jgi:hypothetical protein
MNFLVVPPYSIVIPSEVEGSRGVTLRVTQRDPSTPLRFAQDDGGRERFTQGKENF